MGNAGAGWPGVLGAVVLDVAAAAADPPRCRCRRRAGAGDLAVPARRRRAAAAARPAASQRAAGHGRARAPRAGGRRVAGRPRPLVGPGRRARRGAGRARGSRAAGRRAAGRGGPGRARPARPPPGHRAGPAAVPGLGRAWCSSCPRPAPPRRACPTPWRRPSGSCAPTWPRHRSPRPTPSGCASSAWTCGPWPRPSALACCCASATRSCWPPAPTRRPACILAGLPQPFTAADARLALGTTRRTAIPLLEFLDRAGVTERLPDDRRQVRPRAEPAEAEPAEAEPAEAEVEPAEAAEAEPAGS